MASIASSSPLSLPLLLLPLVLLLRFDVVSASGKFKVSVYRINNYRRARMDGSCCGSGRTSHRMDERCPNECVTRLRVCLKEFIDREIPDSVTPHAERCTFGNMTTAQVGTSSFVYSTPLEGTFNIDFRWTRSFTLILEVFDGDPKAGHVVDRVVYKGVLAPGSKPHNITQVTKRGVRMDYVLAMSCDEYYYDQTCSKYCRPRRDVHGHYTCNEKGEKDCLEGYGGKECNSPICKTGCHNVHGSCDTPGECKCAPGWQGAYCTECIKYPGCKHGSCNNSPWSCSCFLNWGGRFCEKDLNFCGRHRPCLNGGICLHPREENSLQPYRCVCPRGYKGVNCSEIIPPCSLKPCLNGGKCTEYNRNSYYCTCAPGWEGENCAKNKNACVPGTCANGGSCIDLEGPNAFKCSCPTGFKGPNCAETDPCQYSKCKKALSCRNLPNDEFACECQKGWAGKYCDINIDDCAVNKCKNGGKCKDLVDDYFCECPRDFSGRHCELEVDMCRQNSSNPCKNGGICRDKRAGFSCECPKDFTGQLCEIDKTPCDPNPCLNGAYCYNMGSDFYCDCANSHYGKRCEMLRPKCQNGICEVVDPCSSPSPRRLADNSSVHGASASICGKRGRCVASGGGQFRCECDPGFRGKFCQENINDCASNPCQAGATCLDGVNNYQCLCREGFLGWNCEINRNECAPNPCRNDGECIDLQNDFECKCKPGWVGRWCQETEGRKPCDPSTCINEAPCRQAPGKPGGFECDCRPSWMGTQCHIKRPEHEPCAHHGICRNGGTCVNTGDSMMCVCSDGFEGKYCERQLFKCAPNNPCFNGGTCKELHTAYECVCKEGFKGPDCRINLDDCASNPCAYGAACVDEIQKFRCICPEGRSGERCERVIGKTPPKPPSCIYRRMIYDHGKNWSIDCKSCHCDKGKVICVDQECDYVTCRTAPPGSKHACQANQECVTEEIAQERCFVPPCFNRHFCRNRSAALRARTRWPPASDPGCQPNTLSLNNHCSRIRLHFNRIFIPYGVTVEDVCGAVTALKVVQELRDRIQLGVSCGIKRNNKNIIEVAISTVREYHNLLGGQLDAKTKRRPAAHQLAELIGRAVARQETDNVALRTTLNIQVETLLLNSKDWGTPYLLPMVVVFLIIGIAFFIAVILYHFHAKKKLIMQYAPFQEVNNKQVAADSQAPRRNILYPGGSREAANTTGDFEETRRPLKARVERGVEISGPIQRLPRPAAGADTSDSGFETNYGAYGAYGVRAGAKDVNITQRISGDYERESPLVV